MAPTPTDIAALLDTLTTADLAALATAGFRVEEPRELATTPYGASQVEAVLVCHTSAIGREPTDSERSAAATAFRKIGHGPRPDGARDMAAARADAQQFKTRPAKSSGSVGKTGKTGKTPKTGKPRPDRSPVGAWGATFVTVLVVTVVTLVVAMLANRIAGLGVAVVGLLAIAGVALRFPASTRGGMNIAMGTVLLGAVGLVAAAVGGPYLGLRYGGTEATATHVDAVSHPTGHGGRQLYCTVQSPNGKSIDLLACPSSVVNVGAATVPVFTYVYDPNGHQDPALGAKSGQGTGTQYTLLAALIGAAALSGLGIARSRPHPKAP